MRSSGLSGPLTRAIIRVPVRRSRVITWPSSPVEIAAFDASRPATWSPGGAFCGIVIVIGIVTCVLASRLICSAPKSTQRTGTGRHVIGAEQFDTAVGDLHGVGGVDAEHERNVAEVVERHGVLQDGAWVRDVGELAAVAATAGLVVAGGCERPAVDDFSAGFVRDLGPRGGGATGSSLCCGLCAAAERAGTIEVRMMASRARGRRMVMMWLLSSRWKRRTVWGSCRSPTPSSPVFVNVVSGQSTSERQRRRVVGGVDRRRDEQQHAGIEGSDTETCADLRPRRAPGCRSCRWHRCSGSRVSARKPSPGST